MGDKQQKQQAHRICCFRSLSGQCSADIVPRNSFTDDEVHLIRLRSGLSRIDSVCTNHKKNLLEFYSSHYTKCANPFGSHKKPVSKDLYEISLTFAKEYGQIVNLIPGQKLCVNCKRQVPKTSPINEGASTSCETAASSSQQPLPIAASSARHPTTTNTNKPPSGSAQLVAGSSQSSSTSGAGASDDIFPTPPDMAVKAMDTTCEAVGESPMADPKIMKQKSYQTKKLQKIQKAVHNKFSKAVGAKKGVIKTDKNFAETLAQLKSKFSQIGKDRKKQLHILSVLPLSWTISQIVAEFDVPRSFARLAKRLTREQGVLPDIPEKKVRRLEQSVVDKVQNFYRDRENSRELPGKKDYVSVKRPDGTREQKQKRLVLSNLIELYELYLSQVAKEEPDFKVSFSKFCELRPKECVLAGAAGTHTVCVCEHHQNFKLLVDAAALENDEEDAAGKYLTDKDIMKMVMCNPPSDKCYLGQCKSCPGTDQLREMMEINFDLYGLKNISFKEWSSTDRSELVTKSLPSTAFIEKLINQIPDVLVHDLLAKKQGRFLNKKKEELKEGECIVIGDFSENYKPVWQDAVQGVHWSDVQVTIHPFIIYYKNGDVVEHLNYVIISDSTAHVQESVYAFQKQLVPYLMNKISNLKKIYYFSDGAAQQYKNRKMVANLRKHYRDFGVKAEWHFFATSHGKGPCDGLAGSMKRLAARESLQMVSSESISSPFLFYKWAAEKYKDSIEVVYVSKEKIASVSLANTDRMETAPEVAGIKSAHAVIVLSENTVCLKQYSEANTGLYYYYGPLDSVQIDDLHGFVIVRRPDVIPWTVAFVDGQNAEAQEIQVVPLTRQGTRTSLRFKYPDDSPETITMKVWDVIAVCNVESEDGVNYKIKTAVQKLANEKTQTESTSAPAKKKRRNN